MLVLVLVLPYPGKPVNAVEIDAKKQLHQLCYYVVARASIVGVYLSRSLGKASRLRMQVRQGSHPRRRPRARWWAGRRSGSSYVQPRELSWQLTSK